MIEIATTKRQRDLIAHAIDIRRRINDRMEPRRCALDPDYRNYYCASVGSDDDAEITRLCELGLMTKGPLINDGRKFYAYVTEAGIREVMP